MTAAKRPEHLTDAVARTLTRRQILDRLTAEQDYLLGKRRRTARDEDEYRELTRIMYAYVPPRVVLQQMEEITAWLNGGPRTSIMDSRPCDDTLEDPTMTGDPPMKLLMVDESGAVVQEYAGVTAQVDGHDIDGGTVKVVIPGEADMTAGEDYDDGSTR
jgi:hypothetical protein